MLAEDPQNMQRPTMEPGTLGNPQLDAASVDGKPAFRKSNSKGSITSNASTSSYSRFVSRVDGMLVPMQQVAEGANRLGEAGVKASGTIVDYLLSPVSRGSAATKAAEGMHEADMSGKPVQDDASVEGRPVLRRANSKGSVTSNASTSSYSRFAVRVDGMLAPVQQAAEGANRMGQASINKTNDMVERWMAGPMERGQEASQAMAERIDARRESLSQRLSPTAQAVEKATRKAMPTTIHNIEKAGEVWERALASSRSKKAEKMDIGDELAEKATSP
mmetsp:Transcript_93794/g.284841  ORF Transcript_93794/g.284841 Transcript_93794/m.284841 type:complete len:276 (+) Transcript_93794:92-919(+)